MIKTLTKNQFIDEFKSWETYKDNFSYYALSALYDYLVEYEEVTGEKIELDVVALCCDYVEYETAEEGARECFDFEGMSFDEDGGELETSEEVEQKALDFLQSKTQVIKFDGGIIVQQF